VTPASETGSRRPSSELRWPGAGLYAVAGNEGGLAPEQLAAQLGSARWRWCLVEYDADEHERLLAIRQLLDGSATMFGIWEPRPSADRLPAIASVQPWCFAFQAEDGFDDLAYMHQLRTVWPEPFRLAAVTNLWPSRNLAAFDGTAQDLGIDLHVECYVPENPDATVAALVGEGYGRGHVEVTPVIESRDAFRLTGYLPLPASVTGGAFAAWADSTMLPEDWQVAR
jgi:hypothetical protein